LPDLHAKDARQLLRGKWLIEVAELAAFRGKKAETLKAFVTRSEERYRPSYGRKEVIEPRQCLFIGTTNLETYLPDATGGRRFWPVAVGRINVKGLAAARNQLFAEAAAAFREGEKWWPDGEFERAHIKPQQEARFEVDPWEDAIVKYIAELSSVRPSEIARVALDVSV
jgi:predicted P-loop ATPase